MMPESAVNTPGKSPRKSRSRRALWVRGLPNWLPLIPFLLSPAWGACAAGPYANGYAYCRMLTVPSALVPNTDQTAFPVPFTGLFPWLRSAANGGHVQSASGFDIIFTSDNAGTTLINWELVNYDAATGTVEFYVQVTLSHTADTSFYLFYGKSGVLTNQSPGSPWDANFKAVYHFGSASSLGLADSASTNTLTNHSATAGAGIVGGGAQLVRASSQYLSAAASADVDLTGPLTVEAWALESSVPSGTQYPSMVAAIDSGGTLNDGYSLSMHSGDGGAFSNHPRQVFFAAGAETDINAGVAWSANQPHYSAGTYDNVNPAIIYDNGVSVGSANIGANKIGANAHPLLIGFWGSAAYGYWDGWIDEVRLSNSVRSADWIKTTYNSYIYPQFLAVGAQVPAFTSAATCSASANGYSFCRPITIDHTKVGVNAATPIGICLDATMGTNCLTNNKELATVANGGKLTDATNGYDWIITSDAAGATPLNCERVIQNLTTGAAEIWCLPTVSTTSDTTMYLWYGNSLVNTDQTHPTLVWTGYAGVYHFSALSGGISSAADSTANANNITSGSATGVAGLFGAAMNNTPSTLVLNSVPAQFPTGAAARTVEAWFNLTGGGGNAVIDYGASPRANDTEWAIWWDGTGTITLSFNHGSNRANVSNDGQWHYAVTQLPSGSAWTGVNVYLDGVLGIVPTATTGTINTGTDQVVFGGLLNNGGSGVPYIDEVRITSTVRSQAEILTEFYNLSNPSAFMVKGNEQSGSGKVRHRVTME